MQIICAMCEAFFLPWYYLRRDGACQVDMGEMC